MLRTGVALACAAGGLLVLASGEGRAAPRDATPCVCRGLVEIHTDPDPLATCKAGRLTLVFRPICSAQRVHLVYVASPSANASWLLGLGPSVRQLNLRSNPNIYVATVLAPEQGAPFIQPLSNDNTVVQHGLDFLMRGEPDTPTPATRPPGRPSPTPRSGLPRASSTPPSGERDPARFGCAACGIREALALLRRHRDDVAPDSVAEYIAFFGVTRTADEAAQDEPAFQALVAEVEAAKREGVGIIAADRDLASQDATWTGGLTGLGVVFGKLAVDHNGTQLRDMELELRLPEGVAPIPYSVQPGGYQSTGNSLRWTDPPWTIDGVTLTLSIDLLSPDLNTLDWPRLHAHLSSYRGRERSLVLPDPAVITRTLQVVDGCAVIPTATPSPTPDPPGSPPPSPATPPAEPPTPSPTPTRTPWPSPTLGPEPTRGGHRPAVIFLPLLPHQPCAYRAPGLDVLLVLDASTSMRGAGWIAAIRASRAFLEVLAEGRLPTGVRRAGIVRFHDSAALIAPLTGDWAALGARLDELERQGEAALAPGTRIDTGLGEAWATLAAGGQAGHQPVIVLLTDGILPGRYYGQALATARAAQAAGITIYTVGLGTLFDARFLEEIAGDPARFTPAIEPASLDASYRAIAGALACGGLGAGRRLPQVLAQLVAAGGVAQAAERLGLDLADAFAGHAEGLADLFERERGAVDQAEAVGEHLLLALRQAAQRRADRVSQQLLAGGFARLDRVLVGHGVGDLRVGIGVDRRVDRYRVPRELQDLLDPVRRHVHLGRDLVNRRRSAAVLLLELAGDRADLRDLLGHVDRHADGPRLVGQGAGDRLADPPCGIGAELVAAAPVELLGRLHQAHAAVLDQVAEGHAVMHVLLGDMHD